MRYRPWIGLTLLALSVPIDILLTPEGGPYRGWTVYLTITGTLLWATHR